MSNFNCKANAVTFVLCLSYLDASAAPPPLTGRTRLPKNAISDFKTDIRNAPVSNKSDDIIDWCAHANPARRNWLNFGPWGNEWFTPGIVDEWGALHLVEIDNSYPPVDVLISLYPGETDGINATDTSGRRWARGYYRIPEVIQNAPHYIQGGSPATSETAWGDRHLNLYNSETNTFDEFFQARYNPKEKNPFTGLDGVWVASCAARFDASSVVAMHRRPVGWTSLMPPVWPCFRGVSPMTRRTTPMGAGTSITDFG